MIHILNFINALQYVSTILNSQLSTLNSQFSILLRSCLFPHLAFVRGDVGEDFALCVE